MLAVSGGAVPGLGRERMVPRVSSGIGMRRGRDGSERVRASTIFTLRPVLPERAENARPTTSFFGGRFWSGILFLYIFSTSWA